VTRTLVRRDHFSITPQGITHKPTGATFIPHSGSPLSGKLLMGQLGNRLPNGDDYRPDDVKRMIQQLWAEYVAANAEAFGI
jgi:hypothetical protein